MVEEAAFDAGEVCDGWRRRHQHDEPVQQIMRRFHGESWNVHEADPTLEAASYPQLVALTRLLASPMWHEMPLDPSRRDTFLDELRRTVAPHYSWNSARSYGHHEPLVHLFATEVHNRRIGIRPATPIFASAERPMRYGLSHTGRQPATTLT